MPLNRNLLELGGPQSWPWPLINNNNKRINLAELCDFTTARAGGNPAAFHNRDGSGYRFIADQVA